MAGVVIQWGRPPPVIQAAHTRVRLPCLPTNTLLMCLNSPSASVPSTHMAAVDGIPDWSRPHHGAPLGSDSAEERALLSLPSLWHSVFQINIIYFF